MPKFAIGPYWSGATTSPPSSPRDVLPDTADPIPDLDESELTASEMAAAPVEELLNGIRDEQRTTNDRLLEMIDTLAGLAQVTTNDATAARADARDSRRMAWRGIWVAVAIGLISTTATVVGVLT